jgi:[ribosomal protein S18]-alanine N-acetyltransferase
MSAVPGSEALVRRPMTVADLDAVMVVEITAYPWPWSRGNFADTLAAGHWAEVLEDADARLVGYVVAMKGVDELHLLNVTVAPEWQGRGHGTQLLAALRDHARACGAGELWLEVRASNHRARALYRRHGFAEVGLRRQYYPGPPGRREDAVLMSRSVAGAAGELPPGLPSDNADAPVRPDDALPDGPSDGLAEEPTGRSAEATLGR